MLIYLFLKKNLLRTQQNYGSPSLQSFRELAAINKQTKNSKIK